MFLGYGMTKVSYVKLLPYKLFFLKVLSMHIENHPLSLETPSYATESYFVFAYFFHVLMVFS